MKTNKWLIIIFIAGIFATYVFLERFFDEQTSKQPIYRVAELKKIHIIGKNASDWLIFKYYIGDEKYEGRVYISDDKYEFYRSKIGKRYIVGMNKNQLINKIFLTYKLYINNPVPDRIHPENTDGWETLPQW